MSDFDFERVTLAARQLSDLLSPLSQSEQQAAIALAKTYLDHEHTQRRIAEVEANTTASLLRKQSAALEAT